MSAYDILKSLRIACERIGFDASTFVYVTIVSMFLTSYFAILKHNYKCATQKPLSERINDSCRLRISNYTLC